MFSEEMLKEVPEEIEKILKELEREIFNDLIDRISKTNEISRAADYELWMAHQLRRYPEDLRRKIQKALNLTDEQMKHLYKDIVGKGYANDKALYDEAGIPFVPLSENKELKQLIDAVQEQTKDDINNITRTTGIVLQGGAVSETMTQYYRDTLNKALMELHTGAFNYDNTLKRVTNELANSGLRTINYESGHVDRVDVAARRAIMTGLRQVTQKISEDNANKLETNYFEVSAHLTARPSHALWQGRVYTKKQLIDICHLGEVTGLCGANCYHTYDPFIPGVSVRRYSDEELSKIYEKTQETHQFEGKTYTPYQATQKQRALERRMRVQDEKIALLKEGGASKDDINQVKTRRIATYQQYKKFSKEMELPEQMNRVFNSEAKKQMIEEENISKGNDEKVINAISQSNLEDITQSFLDNASPGTGIITYDQGYSMGKEHHDEIEAAKWIHDTFGGDIRLLKESEDFGVKQSDFLWKDKLWDLKKISSEKAIDSALRHGFKQIVSNPGGFILDLQDESISIEKMLEIASKRIKRTVIDEIGIIIMRDKVLLKVLKTKK